MNKLFSSFLAVFSCSRLFQQVLTAVVQQRLPVAALSTDSASLMGVCLYLAATEGHHRQPQAALLPGSVSERESSEIGCFNGSKKKQTFKTCQI